MRDAMALSELADLFAVLGHPDRLRLVQELRAGPRDVASLVEALGASQSRTSQQLGLLKAHHLVIGERDGRRVYYRLRDQALPPWALGGLVFLDTGAAHGQPLDASISALNERYG
jgi:DNA-binding transcriptional ArsR family regulator